MKYEVSLEKIRGEVEQGINVWEELFRTRFPEKLEYMYVKGSAIKTWSSEIDYVPVLSDLDIHIKLTQGTTLLPGNKTGFKKATRIAEQYERIYREKTITPIHIPRSQVVVVNRLYSDPDVLKPSRLEPIKTVFGVPEYATLEEEKRIKHIDLKNLHLLKDTVNRLPDNAMDRIGLDSWLLIRRLNWRVSPAPKRLLTQFHHDPVQVWCWNRTKICEMLHEYRFDHIAESYRAFYQAGWDMFMTKFHDNKVMRRVLSLAFNVLESCYSIAEKMG